LTDNFASSAPAAALPCAICGRTVPVADLLQLSGQSVCAHCKPLVVQRLRAGETALPSRQIYAGFWIRAGAKLIDGLLLYIFNILTTGALLLAFGMPLLQTPPGKEPDAAALGWAMGAYCAAFVIQFLASMVYNVVFLKRFGATPGKMALRLKVVRADGSPLTTGRAFGRFFGDMLSGMVMCVGYLLVAFDEVEKRALHDHLCDTRVIRA
jgi:uncharacterized RDD family membrane protein YckC